MSIPRSRSRRPEYRSSRPTSGPTISSRRPPRMWAIPARVNLNRNLIHELDALRMNCQQAGKVVCVTNVVPKAVGDESNAYDWTRSHQQGRERSGTLTGQRTGAE